MENGFIFLKQAGSSLLRVSIISYLGLCVMLYFLQEDILYHPQPLSSENKQAMTSGFREISLPTVDKNILKWWECNNPSAKKALLYFGWNAEEISPILPIFSSFSGYCIVGLNYRGYGESTGYPNEAFLKQDALLIYDHLAQKYPSISLVGRSLWTGVATYVAANRKIGAVVLITPYDSMDTVAQSKFGIFPIFLLLRNHYNSSKAAKTIKSPALLFAAQNDLLIPYRSTAQLQKDWKNSQLLVIPNVGHDTIIDSQEMVASIKQFLDTH